MINNAMNNAMINKYPNLLLLNGQAVRRIIRGTDVQ